MSEALKLGITRYMLYTLRDKGIIEQISRGVYRLADLPPVSNPDLMTVSIRFPSAVICLVSALAFHDITTQIPHNVSVAVARNAHVPSLDYPPLVVYRFSGKAYKYGVEEYLIDNVRIKIYSPEKTLADCFKFRNKIGMDVVLEALTLYKKRKNPNIPELIKSAEICRIKNVMMPYLEAGI